MDRMMTMNSCYQISAEDKEPLKMARADVEALKHHEVHLKGHDFIAAAVKRLGDDFAGYVKGAFVEKLQPLIEVQDYLTKVEVRMGMFAEDMRKPYPAWADNLAEHTKELEKYIDEHKQAADSPASAFIKTAVAAIKKPTLVTPPVMPKDEKPYGVSRLPPLEPVTVSEPVRQLPTLFTSRLKRDQEHEKARETYLEYLKAMQAHYAALSVWAQQRSVLEAWAKFDLQMNKYALAKERPVTTMIANTIAAIKKKISHCAKPVRLPDEKADEAQEALEAAREDALDVDLAAIIALERSNGVDAATPAGQDPATPAVQDPATPGGEDPAMPGGVDPATPGGQDAATPDGEGAMADQDGGGVPALRPKSRFRIMQGGEEETAQPTGPGSAALEGGEEEESA